MNPIDSSSQHMASLKVDGVLVPSTVPSTSYSHMGTHIEPPLQMTSIRFDGNNNPAWRRAVCIYLLGRGKVRFLEQSPPDVEDPTYANWEQEDAVIRSFLWGCMDSQLAANMMYLDSSKEVWDQAAILYSRADNITHMCDLFSEWFKFQHGDMSTIDHYSSYISLCRQLDTLMPFTVNPIILAERQEKLRVVHYLDSLGPDYLQMRQQIYSSWSLPSLSEPFSRVQRMRTVPVSDHPLDGSALATSIGGDRARSFTRLGRGRDGGSRGRSRDGGSASPALPPVSAATPLVQ
ncbi:uncharacterized protein LOC143888606 [Tasmannia lanceolata]|uniref:uncharacterized protein LOC143888606 n=1 Tax=Tasmannia lanceolata TaxID=3420 RepID=UPI0040640F42